MWRVLEIVLFLGSLVLLAFQPTRILGAVILVGFWCVLAYQINTQIIWKRRK